VCPCAQRYQVTTTVVDVLKTSTWRNVPEKFRLIVSGANNPFGVADARTGKLKEDTGEVLEQLEKLGVCVVPDWVANSGTAQLFHRGLSLDFDFKLAPELVADQVLRACAEPISRFITEAVTRLRHAGVSGAAVGPALSAACLQLAEERLAHPVPMDASGGAAHQTHRSRYALPPMDKLPSLEERFKSCVSVSPAGECIEEAELKELLRTCSNPVAYDGFGKPAVLTVLSLLVRGCSASSSRRSATSLMVFVAA
jgi:hypothetical protein